MTKLKSNLFENLCARNVRRILTFPIFKSNLLIHPPLSSTIGQYSRWQATDLRVIQLVERGLTELYYSLPTWSGDLTAPVFSLCLRVRLIWDCLTWGKIALFLLQIVDLAANVWECGTLGTAGSYRRVCDWSSKHKVVVFTEHGLNPILFVLLTWFKRMKWICIEEQQLGWFFVV